MQTAKEELEKDLVRALENIDFKAYHPCSKRFVAAMNIGLMLDIINKQLEREPIMEEIDGAKKYLADFKSTGDTTYKNMAHDELRHAEILLHKAKTGMPGAEHSNKLKMYESKIAALKQEVSNGQVNK